ncbi:ABC transporter ATP-binding protein [Paenibacillus sp. PK3_47]|uniref:ABC transporter ATP-binding protein n=1 Tax=Paenibacillus sp. PK3_47 TaxID=2072642 RepID=UPI00201DBBF3|nr:ABC transporter ATP-binding protein [Paenibacillus sp. PK3_47]
MQSVIKRFNLKGFHLLLSVVWRTSPFMFVAVLLVTLANTALQFIPVLMPKVIIDELMGQCRNSILARDLALFVAVSLGLNILTMTLQYYINTKNLEITKAFNLKIGSKLLTMDYEYTESPAALDKKEQAYQAISASGGITSLLNTLISTISSLFSIAGMIYILSTLNYLLIGIIVLIILINTLLQKKSRNIQYSFWHKLIPVNREYNYFFRTILDFNFGKDIRLYNIKDLLLQKSKQNMKKTVDNMMELTNKKSLYACIMEVAVLIQQGGVYGYMAYKVLNNSINIGSFTMYVSAVYKLSQNINLIIGYIINLSQSLLYLKAFVEFIDLPELKQRSGQPVKLTNHYQLKLVNVSFKYPSADHYTLHNISLTLNSGDRLSVVGMNGSGKTTLIKLITRLYDPTEGEILLNGVNIKSYDYREYLDLFSVVFQDFRFLAASLKDNVTAGKGYGDRSHLLETLGKVDLHLKIEGFVDREDTMLYKIFDEQGVDLSGGESQRLAIARALYKDAPIVILDEPTAALDPLAEYYLYSHFNELTANKTAIYISHRLSSCKFCDTIAVFQRGQLIENGSHEELMSYPSGVYREMFNAQAKQYVTREDRNRF